MDRNEENLNNKIGAAHYDRLLSRVLYVTEMAKKERRKDRPG